MCRAQSRGEGVMSEVVDCWVERLKNKLSRLEK